jgi:hypothetical protein
MDFLQEMAYQVRLLLGLEQERIMPVDRKSVV